jgi:hypothetical protein
MHETRDDVFEFIHNEGIHYHQTKALHLGGSQIWKVLERSRFLPSFLPVYIIIIILDMLEEGNDS